jgi:hypothetical protein
MMHDFMCLFGIYLKEKWLLYYFSNVQSPRD